MEKKQGQEQFRYVKNATTGITLIALTITIILLLILAGVVINLTIGENGILNYAKEAKVKTEEEVAREKLELVLLDLQAKKYTDTTYNETTYIDTAIRENGMAVNGDVVFVDGWQFQLDRSVPKIGISLGRGELEEQIQIVMTSEMSTNYEKATIYIEISYEKEITSIILNGEEITIPEKQNEKYLIEKEVTDNGTYSVIAKDAEEKYNVESIMITDITEDMNIYNVEDMIAFRDKVNSGRTFKGKTVQLMNDIELNKNKYTIAEDGTLTFDNTATQWTPIGEYQLSQAHYFYGTFEGNNHSVKGVFIDDETKHYQGLFGINYGTIKNLAIEEGTIVSGPRTGAIAGGNYGTIDNAVNKIDLEAKTETSSGNSVIGGITGFTSGGIIKNSTNYGNVIGTASQVGGICGIIENLKEDMTNCANLCKQIKAGARSTDGMSLVGGIVGYGGGNITQSYNIADVIGNGSNVGGIAGSSFQIVMKCYNTGTVQSLGINSSKNNNVGGISGYAANTISECYNLGNVTGTTRQVGGIVGSNASSTVLIKQEIRNCYNIGNIGKGVYYGGIVGGGEGASNCYYLNGKASSGVGGSTSSNGTDTGATAKTETQLKGLTATLGREFTSDSSNINNGYPILKWQVEE